MRVARVVAMFALAAAGCSLTTSLDGLSEPTGGGSPDGGSADGGDARTPFAGASAVAYRSEVLKDAPIAYYRFTEQPGATTAQDETGHHPATYMNGPVPAPTGGPLAGDSPSVTLDGVDDRLECTSLGDLPSTTWTAMSIEVWARFARTTAKAVAMEFELAGEDTWKLSRGVSTKLELAISGQFLYGPEPSANRWYHLVATSDAQGATTYWVDGAVVATGTFTNRPKAKSTFVIGADYDGAEVNDYIPGQIAELAIYGAALSPERIAAHRAAGGL